MLEYNNDNIMTGYIKQLLYSFNLPKCKVFNSVQELLTFASTKDRIGIVKNYKNNLDYIVHVNSKNEITSSILYRFNLYYPNITTNLKLIDNTYTAECHKYLGNYLRFLRDYKDLNLMTMYNCYSGKTLTDNNYKYIIIPCKSETKYTLALTANNYYITYLTESTLNKIQKHFTNLFATESNIKTFSTKFYSPVVITSDKLTDIFNENNYNMIIRLPIDTDFVLTILEGDYTRNREEFTKIQFNFDKEDTNIDYEKVDFKRFLSDFQLLNKLLPLNKKSYPLADRLLEYLTGMVIVPGDEISKNVIDAKYKVYENYGNTYYIDDQGQKIYPYNNIQSKLGFLNDSFKNIDRARFFDALGQTKFKYKNTYDILGYVDKDIESVINITLEERG